MAQIINTNLSSINTQRHLNTSKNDLQTAIERLSSGLRVNNARDDAAGFAVATRMDSWCAAWLSPSATPATASRCIRRQNLPSARFPTP